MSASQDNPSASKPSSLDSQDAIALFDSHLRLLSDSYLGFFQERKRIEEIYVDSLKKLHIKAKSIDSFLDIGDLSTARVAWGEVRDNVDREADTRAAFVGTLASDVIAPLLTFKETQERIRKRIKEDLKDAITTHTDFAENTLPRLKRVYLRKCQEAEEYKSAAAAAPSQPPSVSPEPHPTSTPRSSNNPPVRPVVTSPQPLRPLDRRPSGSAVPQRARSPSSSNAFQDLAHQGKKQLNQLIGFLDKGGGIKEGGSGRADQALRSVRAKREADEADKEYRKAVYWLETLRLRRVKILESGYKSLETCIRESAETIKSVLTKYTDNMIATAATQSQLCTHGRRMVDKISPQKDTAFISSYIPKLLAASIPKPINYYNYNVGECKDLIFGVSLVDYATARGMSDGEVPKIVRMCIQEIELRGMDAEGIYRAPGRHAAVQELQHKIERNEAAFAFNPAVDDVYVVSSFLKLYLRELPEPLFKFPVQERIQHTEDMQEHLSNNFVVLRSKIRRLPAIHQATLKAVVEHLARLSTHSDKNKMDAKNLAIVFSAVVFGEDELPKGGDLMSMQSWKDTLMEDLITNAQGLFQSSPALPPAPSGEPVPPITYGSSHTKVANVPAPRSTTPLAPPMRASASNEPRSPQDFTPQLPPRPANSIHPSLRSGPMSSSPARQSMPPPSRTAQFFDEQTIAAALPHIVSPSKPERKDSSFPSPWDDDNPSLMTKSSTAAESDGDDDVQTVSIVTPAADKVGTSTPASAPPSTVSFDVAAGGSASSSSNVLVPPSPIRAVTKTTLPDLPIPPDDAGEDGSRVSPGISGPQTLT